MSHLDENEHNIDSLLDNHSKNEKQYKSVKIVKAQTEVAGSGSLENDVFTIRKSLDDRASAVYNDTIVADSYSSERVELPLNPS